MEAILIGLIIVTGIGCELLYRTLQATNKLTSQNSIIMAQLSDFQAVGAQIDATTKTIAAYVQGTGMSAADQDTALKVVQDAATALTATIPAALVS